MVWSILLDNNNSSLSFSKFKIIFLNFRFHDLPRLSPSSVPSFELVNLRKATISQYFSSSLCLLCDEPIVSSGLCASCASNQQTSAFLLNAMQRLREKDEKELLEMCRSCTGNVRIQHNCLSLDCVVLFKRVKALHHLQLINKYQEALDIE